MDFIIEEAEVSDEIYCKKSDCSDNEGLLDNDFVVSDQNCHNDSSTFYIKYENFRNQQKNPQQEIVKNDFDFGEDGQPEMFSTEVIDDVEFHNFQDYKRKAENLKKTLLGFPPDTEPNCFFALWFMLSRIYRKMKSLQIF